MYINNIHRQGENSMSVTNDIFYAGVNDHQIDLFESQFPVPLGMAYNSYVIMDEKIAVVDTIEAKFTQEWLGSIKKILQGRKPDYLIVQHMEPDHSASIGAFKEEYPDAVVVATAQAFKMIGNYFRGLDLGDKKLTAGNETTLELGRHKLVFYTAPMVHWPEVMMTYDTTDKVLFSADAFGKFGANDVEDPEGWDCEARRYYFGIVGKFGAQVQAVLKKLGALEIRQIASLHGPVLSGDLSHYISLYDTWSSYRPEKQGVTVAYTSVYGNTGKAAKLLAEELENKGCEDVKIFDLSRDDVYEALECAFMNEKLVLATTTYNNGIFPAMKKFIDLLTERGYKNRKLAIIENGSWGPMAAKVIRTSVEGLQNIEILDTITILSSMSPENEEQLRTLADRLSAE